MNHSAILLIRNPYEAIIGHRNLDRYVLKLRKLFSKKDKAATLIDVSAEATLV